MIKIFGLILFILIVAFLVFKFILIPLWKILIRELESKSYDFISFVDEKTFEENKNKKDNIKRVKI